MKDKSTRGDKWVLCPFYRCHNATEIGCEGVAPENRIRLVFRSGAGMMGHKRMYCDRYWKICPLAGAIWEQYGGRDEEERAA